MPSKNTSVFLTPSQINKIEDKLGATNRAVVTYNGGRNGKTFVVHTVDTYLAKRKTGRRVGKLNKKA